MAAPNFDMHESEAGGEIQLRLLGELDIATAPALEDRLNRLRDHRSPVRLDLSSLDFVDSTGIGVLLRAVVDARRDGWELRVDRELTPQVKQVFELVNVKDVMLGDERPLGTSGDA